MPKQKLSITLDELVLKKIDQKVKKGEFANRSFAIEFLCRNALNRRGV